ncbi:MAG: TRAP transporter permease [Firmicutes bacterium]|nr:TRAP transporter permease [Bacillota bacterium]
MGKNDAVTVKDEAVEQRKLTGRSKQIIAFLAASVSVFHLYVAKFGILEALQMRALHLGLLLPFAFLLYPGSKKSPRDKASPLDIALAITALLVCLYVGLFEYDRMITRWVYVDPLTSLDKVVAVAMILLVFEGARRTTGLPLCIVAAVGLAYVWVGKFLPGRLAHAGVSVTKLLEHLCLTTEGVFGTPIGAAATFIYLFVLFGSFLNESGAGQFFIDLARGLAGGTRGGPAKVAVISSALMGTVSGSAVANVVGTGSYTIPLMKSLRYKPAFAGAVEAAASTGGQIMPPVMGVAAFILAEFVGIPYIKVCAAAALPAVLYFFAILMMVDFEAARTGLVGLPKEELPDVKQILKQGWHLLFPLILVLILLTKGYTPHFTAFWCIIATFLVTLVRKETRMTPEKVFKALASGATGAVIIATSCAIAGVIIGVVSLTGLGVKFTSMVLSFAGGRLPVALFLTMIASLVLGMGVPTTAAYVMVAALAVPAIVQMGVNRLAAHLFAFYFACISTITPPVATSAYAAAGIAKSDPIETGFLASKLGVTAFIVPYMFVYGPELLLMGEPLAVVRVVISSLIGVVALAGGLQGWLLGKCQLWERVLLVASALMLIEHNVITDIIGLAVLILVILNQRQYLPAKQAKSQ